MSSSAPAKAPVYGNLDIRQRAGKISPTNYGSVQRLEVLRTRVETPFNALTRHRTGVQGPFKALKVPSTGRSLAFSALMVLRTPGRGSFKALTEIRTGCESPFKALTGHRTRVREPFNALTGYRRRFGLSFKGEGLDRRAKSMTISSRAARLTLGARRPDLRRSRGTSLRCGRESVARARSGSSWRSTRPV